LGFGHAPRLRSVPIANGAALKWIGVEPSSAWHWSVAFAVPFVVLLPATAAMGATLPVVERFVTPLTRSGRSVGALYAANTLGAVTGVLCSTFLILPQLGLRGTLFVFAAVNLACGFIALLVRDRRQTIDLLRKDAVAPPRLWVTLFVTGLLGIGYEVVGVRVLSRVLEDTVYTYAAILAVYLLGTSLGAVIYQRCRVRLSLADLLCAIPMACVASMLLATQADDFYEVLRMRLPQAALTLIAAEMAVAATVFFLPTIAMGATFAFLGQLATETRLGLSRGVALNTVGAALAPPLFSVVILPLVGSKWAWAIIALGYLLVVPQVRGWRWVVVVTVPAAFVLLPAHFAYVNVPSGGHMDAYLEGTMASVVVVRDASGHRTLRVDNRFQMGGTGVADAEYRHAHIPLLLHPSPRRALFLGLGTGITLGAAASHTNVVADGVELLPEVIAMMPRFSPYNDSVRTNERVRVHVADAPAVRANDDQSLRRDRGRLVSPVARRRGITLYHRAFHEHSRTACAGRPVLPVVAAPPNRHRDLSRDHADLPHRFPRHAGVAASVQRRCSCGRIGGSHGPHSVFHELA
jgi:spermidine synthase